MTYVSCMVVRSYIGSTMNKQQQRMQSTREGYIADRQLRHRALEDKRRAGVIISVFAAGCEGLSLAALDEIFRVSGKAGRAHFMRSSDHRGLRVLTPACRDRLLLQEPFLVQSASGVRKIRCAKWDARMPFQEQPAPAAECETVRPPGSQSALSRAPSPTTSCRR